MRKLNKKITDAAVIIDLLNSCQVGRLGTVGLDGWPMVKPLNFVYHAGNIYFHTALEGEKIEQIRSDSRVSFEVDLPIAYVRGTAENPCRATCLYRSAIIRGRASIIEERGEKVVALNALMGKYQPTGNWQDYPDDKLAITGIVRIDIEQMRGKEDLGKDGIREIVLQALLAKVPLPVELG